MTSVCPSSAVRSSGRGPGLHIQVPSPGLPAAATLFHRASRPQTAELSMGRGEPGNPGPSQRTASLCQAATRSWQEMLKQEEGGWPTTFYHHAGPGGPCLSWQMSSWFCFDTWRSDAGERLFPCHQFVNDPAYSMGDVWKGVTNTTMGEKFHRCNVVANPACRDCWARLYCAGGCAANAYHASGDINGTYEYGCELFKKRIECAIMIKAAQAGRPR